MEASGRVAACGLHMVFFLFLSSVDAPTRNKQKEKKERKKKKKRKRKERGKQKRNTQELCTCKFNLKAAGSYIFAHFAHFARAPEPRT